MTSETLLVFGCGNPLFGDDGFGPSVIEQLNRDYILPENMNCLDAGTSIRDLLFDIVLSEVKPKKIIIIDACDRAGKRPGEVFEIDVDEVSAQKSSDFSLHQFPTVNMLKEIRDYTSTEVRVLAVQISEIPPFVREGLSAPVENAIPEMCLFLLKIANQD
jgi:coenzyme F420 hydrogenase subunit delta